MSINPLLEHFGFTEDPFASTNAGQEPRLGEYFVPPPYFHAVLGDPSVPQSHVVLAPRGGGKTAQRRMVEDFSAREGRFLCVTYDRFELPGGFRLENADLAYHLGQICRALLLALLIEMDERPELASRLTDHHKRVVKYGIDRFLGTMSAAEFEDALKAIKSRGDKVKDWLKRYQVVMTLINMATNKLGLGSVTVAEGAFELGTQDQSLRYQMGQLFEIARAVGFTSTYILVDGVDELGLTSTDATAAFRFIQSLITDLPTLEAPGAAFKFFMWDQIAEPFQAAGSRPDRIPQFRLRWTESQLEEMMQKRLAAFSDGQVGNLNALVCSSSTLDLQKLVSYLAAGSPRDMVRLAQRIVAEETRESGESQCISNEAVWEGIRVFARERSNELFSHDYLDQLAKVGRATFTISQLASDIFRITENAARSRVQKWQDTGLVDKVGEVPSKGRPQNLYGVTDLRLAIAMLPAMDVDVVLGRVAVECPTCYSICISDRDQVSCPGCGSNFPLSEARSLLEICQR